MQLWDCSPNYKWYLFTVLNSVSLGGVHRNIDYAVCSPYFFFKQMLVTLWGKVNIRSMQKAYISIIFEIEIQFKVTLCCNIVSS